MTAATLPRLGRWGVERWLLHASWRLRLTVVGLFLLAFALSHYAGGRLPEPARQWARFSLTVLRAYAMGLVISGIAVTPGRSHWGFFGLTIAVLAAWRAWWTVITWLVEPACMS